MSKYIKSIVWSVFVVITYVVLQLVVTEVIGEGIFHFQLDHSDPKSWGGFLFVEQLNINLILVIPIVISMLIYSILYRFILKESIETSYGFSKAGVKNIFIGMLIGFTLSLLGSLILINQAWNELVYKKGILNLFQIFENHDMLIITKNTFLVNIVSIITMAVVIPFFEEILFRGLILNKLRTSMPIWVAIILQALLFGILRGNVPSGAYAFIIGLLLGVIYMITKSIWVTVIIHAILNINIMAIKEISNMSVLLGFSSFNTTEVIDTFVYNSLIGNKPDTGPTGMPIMINILFATIISLGLVFLITWLWKANSRHRAVSVVKNFLNTVKVARN